MLQARLFDDFCGARTLLVWGDVDGIRALAHGLKCIVNGDAEALVGDRNPLALGVAERLGHSHVTSDGGNLRWECSIDTLEKANDLIGPLLTEHGHQYVDATGDAEQVIISAGEYPPDL